MIPARGLSSALGLLPAPVWGPYDAGQPQGRHWMRPVPEADVADSLWDTVLVGHIPLALHRSPGYQGEAVFLACSRPPEESLLLFLGTALDVRFPLILPAKEMFSRRERSCDKTLAICRAPFFPVTKPRAGRC